MTLSAECSAPGKRARIRCLPGETPPCTLMVSGACKIHRGCNVLQVPCQLLPLEVPWQSDGLATCLRIKIERPIVSGSALGLTPRHRQKPNALLVRRKTPYIHPSILYHSRAVTHASRALPRQIPNTCLFDEKLTSGALVKTVSIRCLSHFNLIFSAEKTFCNFFFYFVSIYFI